MKINLVIFETSEKAEKRRNKRKISKQIKETITYKKIMVQFEAKWHAGRWTNGSIVAWLGSIVVWFGIFEAQYKGKTTVQKKGFCFLEFYRQLQS